MDCERIEAHDDSVEMLLDAWKSLKISGDIEEELELEDYVDVDDGLITSWLNN